MGPTVFDLLLLLLAVLVEDDCCCCCCYCDDDDDYDDDDDECHYRHGDPLYHCLFGEVHDDQGALESTSCPSTGPCGEEPGYSESSSWASGQRH